MPISQGKRLKAAIKSPRPTLTCQGHLSCLYCFQRRSHAEPQRQQEMLLEEERGKDLLPSVRPRALGGVL